MLLDEAAFQNKCFKLTGGHNIFKIPNILYHAVDLGCMFVHTAEIAADTVFQRLCLTDIDNLPLLSFMI